MRASVRPEPVSPAMRLLLTAAVGDADQAARAWASWLDQIDIEHLEDGATALLSLVSRNIEDLHASPSIEGRVRGVRRQTWTRNQLLWAAGSPLVDRITELTGAPPLLLPPTALHHAYGGDWGARPLERIQFHLPCDAGDIARAALAETGWEVDHITPALLARTRDGRVERWQSQDRAGNWASIRWHVLRGIWSGVADEQLRGAAQVSVVGSSRVHLLHPADALVERLWTGRIESGPGWIADAVQMARRLGGDDDRHQQGAMDRFARRTRDLGILPQVKAQLELAAATVPDPSLRSALVALQATRPTATSILWRLPGRAARGGRSWAGHAAGQGVIGGGRSLVRAQVAARQPRSTEPAQRGSDQRR